jgi:glycogen(starch) synthase
VRSLRLGRSVQLAGFLPDVDQAALLAAADCVVVPSLYEPFGMVALEAAAAGTPLVVADTGGLREIVEPGITGLAFAPGDADGLAQAVCSLASDHVLARRTARAAHRKVAWDLAWGPLGDRGAAAAQWPRGRSRPGAASTPGGGARRQPARRPAMIADPHRGPRPAPTRP